MICPTCGKKIPEDSAYCLYCGAPVLIPEPESEAEATLIAEPQKCTRCGRELPDSSISNLCVSCLHDDEQKARYESARSVYEEDDFAPAEPVIRPSTQNIYSDLPKTDSKRHFKVTIDDDAYGIPDIESTENATKPFAISIDDDGFNDIEDGGPPKGRFPKKILVLLLTLAVVMCVVIFVPKLFSDSSNEPPASSAPAMSAEEQYAVISAQEMVKRAAYSPSSVHFDRQSLKITGENNTYVISQRFERDTASAKSVASEYSAKLTLNGGVDAGYTAIMLKVDDDVIYDYSAGSSHNG